MTSRVQLRAMAGRASSQTPYICLQCRRQVSTAARRATPRLRTAPLPRRSASSTPFMERIRSKIWGTDAPPGQEDPYGAPGTFEQQRNQRLAGKDEEGSPDGEAPRAPAIVEQPQDGSDLEESGSTMLEGMRVVGHADYGLKGWDRRHLFEGYMENTRAQDRDVIISIIHRALVEVMTLRKAKLPLVVRRSPYESTHDYNSAVDYEHYKYRIAQGATFGQSDDGEMTLKLVDDDLEHTILECIVPKEPTDVAKVAQSEASPDKDYVDEEQQEEVEEEVDASSLAGQEELEAATSEEADTLEDSNEEEVETLEGLTEDEPQGETLNVHPQTYVPADGSWRSLSLVDAEFKFAVLKRVMQLTGRRIPDPDIASIKDSKALFAHLVRKPKAKKLVQMLRANEVVGLPNVELHDRRYTPIHKEREIGRWKVIERELRARGLPVTGKGTVAVGRRVA